ncbi:sensor histidine kinase, partial [Streptomyces griseoincarnatus]
MRARVLQATIAAVAVAVLLLGIPLAIFGARYIYDQEVQRVETRAQDLLSSAVNSYERNRSAAEAGFVDQSVLDRAVQPQGNDIVAFVTVNQPNGEQLTSGDPVSGATIDRGFASDEQPVMGVVISVSAWPAYIKAINVVVLVVFGSVGAFAAGAVTAAWQANRLAQPFVYLAASAEQLGAGQVRPRLDPSGVEEIDLVAAELARSSDRLAARLAVERQFTSDASHQLRTPLTALTMRLEEITLTSSEPEVQEEARISLEQVERLVGVVDDLLARSRRAQGGTTESVD